MDFVQPAARIKRNVVEIYPKFKVMKSKDLMIRGNRFYALYNENTGLWTKDEFEAVEAIDNLLRDKTNNYDTPAIPLYLSDAETNQIDVWHKYCQKQMPDNYKTLDSKLIFANQETKREDYASKKLSYPLIQGPTEAYDELINVLYSPDEKHKLEWAIGSVVAGDSKEIQKFVVLYGEKGSGKSSILNIIEMLFEGYVGRFDSKALGNANNAFALEAFAQNPLVAIQHDGDLSKVEDNTKLNSLVSHETMSVNEKHKNLYEMKFQCFLFMGSNYAVKITDAKSGLLRRLIDVNPTGIKVPRSRYDKLMKKIPFELGGIAYKCLQVYLQDPNYYNDYVPTEMMEKTNDTYNFIKENNLLFKNINKIKVNDAWRMYKEYCEDARVPFPLSKMRFKDEFGNYWKALVDDEFSDFKYERFESSYGKKPKKIEEKKDILELNCTNSLLDDYLKDCPAQYSNQDGVPSFCWDNVTTTLKSIDTTKEHYVMAPEHLVTVDFDIKDENGNKCKEKNLEAAAKWPSTYAELSKSGSGVHLEYIYDGDVSKLSRIFDKDIEIKVCTGKASLRRKLTFCNDIPIAHLNTGLPLKEEVKRMYDKEHVITERGIRVAIQRALAKEIHANTAPNVSFIKKVLEDAYSSGIKYDVSDMKEDITIFASLSSHQSKQCLNMVSQMPFKSKNDEAFNDIPFNDDRPIVFFDVEVFKNLFVIVTKEYHKDECKIYINPSPDIVCRIMEQKLVGFNCRDYDNHIIYGRSLGLGLKDLYELSYNIINGSGNRKYRDAFNVSYTDIYDYARDKMSLKKWEIKLGIHHHELGLEWDQEVPEELWQAVADYCCDDVRASEAVFDATSADFKARLILSEITGMTPNDTTNSITTRLIFGKEKNPKLVYTHLEDTFPGYEFREMRDDEVINNVTPEQYKRFIEKGADIKPRGNRNMYRGVDLSFGGYVYAKPGMYKNVALLDVASLHPHSALAMRYFGEYDQRFRDLVDARVYIKHKEFDKLNDIFDGIFAKYCTNPDEAKALSNALKLAINSVYGLTSAAFANPFKIEENKNNIIALRGALFMKTLQDEVTARGFTVVHIKTDSIKIADATPEIIDFCMEFAKKYEYEFEHEATYEKICLVNNAVYIAKDAADGHWTATGTQFQIPFVFKTLFSKEPLTFDDLCVTKSVQTAMYLDMNENLGADEHQYNFIGKTGYFVPVKDGNNGGILVVRRIDGHGNVKYDSVTGTKRKNGIPYRFFEAEDIREKNEEIADSTYWISMVDDAVKTISEYGDFESFAA